MLKYWIAVFLPLCGILAGSVGAYFELIPSLRGFYIFLFSLWLGVLIFGVGIFLFLRGRKEAGFVLTVPGCIYIIMIAGYLLWDFSFPRINDITSDLDSPPTFVELQKLPENADRDFNFPESYKPIIADRYQKLRGFEYPKSYDEVYLAALELAKANPEWVIIAESPEAGRIEGVATSTVFKFKSDFVIRVVSLSSRPVIRVDMRSKSRVGDSDLGANAKRILGFFRKLEEKLGVAPQPKSR